MGATARRNSILVGPLKSSPAALRPPPRSRRNYLLASDLRVSHLTAVPALAISMQRSVHDMEVALRVLSALTCRQKPDLQDVEELHRIISAAGYDSLDEIACAVIEQALEHRRRVRDASLNAREQFTPDGRSSYDHRDGG
jgi:hypothetical protein